MKKKREIIDLEPFLIFITIVSGASLVNVTSEINSLWIIFFSSGIMFLINKFVKL